MIWFLLVVIGLLSIHDIVQMVEKSGLKSKLDEAVKERKKKVRDLECTIYKLDNINIQLALSLGERPIREVDFFGKYCCINAGDNHLHNRTVVQLPNGKYQIVSITKTGEISGSSKMGTVDSEEELLNYMNQEKYIKLREQDLLELKEQKKLLIEAKL